MRAPTTARTPAFGSREVVAQLGDAGHDGDDCRDRGAEDAHGAAVGPLHVRLLLAEQDGGGRHWQDVRDHGREHRHVQQRRNDLRAELLLLKDVHEHGDRIADDRAGDQRDVRCLPLTVRRRQELGKVTGA